MSPAGRTVVVDLEATCWDARDPVLSTRQRAETEVVEIGAVRLDGGPPATFRAFVRPVRHPKISAFCTELTGITQADVDGAAPFPEVWPAFLAFCGGDDDDLVLASWGAFDDGLLRRECRRHHLRAPRWTHLNVKAKYAARRDRVPLGVALEALGLPFAGRAHRGLDDARNVARVWAWLQLPA